MMGANKNKSKKHVRGVWMVQCTQTGPIHCLSRPHEASPTAFKDCGFCPPHLIASIFGHFHVMPTQVPSITTQHFSQI